MPRRFARATDIGEFIRHRSCQRRFKLGYDNQALYKQLPFSDRPFHVIDPVLKEAGAQREEEWAASLIDAGLLPLQSPEARRDPLPWAELCARLADAPPGQDAFAREVEIRGQLGAFEIVGRIDFALLRWIDGKPHLRLVESKASRRDRVYHRAQVTLYRSLVRDVLASDPLVLGGQLLGPGDVDCVVVRLDEATNAAQPILALPPFPMIETMEADLQRLLAEGGLLDRALDAPLDALPFQLDSKCDDCVFSVHCFAESARQRRLELLGVRPTVARALRAFGLSTLDDLAAFDPDSEQADALRSDPRLAESVEQLQTLAQTRCATLPGRDPEQPAFHVRALPYAGKGQLPPHASGGHRVVRAYLVVSYDYVENRVNGLAAHVTRSDGELITPFVEGEDGKARPSHDIRDRRVEFDEDTQERRVVADRPIAETAIELCRIQTVPWSGRYEQDNGAEAQLLQGFLRELVDAIVETADADEAPIHFYLWSRQEMKHLLEACSRAGSGLMRHIRELLGCREGLEQLIYSCLQEEVHTRFALGWTSKGLVVAASLRWFGERFHWLRPVGHRGKVHDLERDFSRDVFDFRTALPWMPGGAWAPDERTPGAELRRFEVRSRCYDELTAPYWRAYWGTLPEAPPRRPDVARAMQDYQVGRVPGAIQALLTARAQALRWLDERVRFKNPDILKPPVRLAELPGFTLATRHVADAAVDFLKLDHHVKLHDWLHTHFVPPYVRLARGLSLLLRNLRVEERRIPGKLKRDGSPRAESLVVADLDVDAAAVDTAALSARISLGEDSFARLARRSPDPQEGQSFYDLVYGKTCVIRRLDWDGGRIELSIIPSWQDASYVLPSLPFKPGSADERDRPYAYATLDASISDFVADRIEERLSEEPLKGRHVLRWFDPQRPYIPPMPPLPDARAGALRAFLESYRFNAGKHGLSPERAALILEGMNARVQLVQGPPGTGKTMVTAFAILSRVLARHAAGDVLLVAAHTHTAVDTLLKRILAQRSGFWAAARAAGLPMPAVEVAKVESSPEAQMDGDLHLLAPKGCYQRISRLAQGGVVVIGGTVGGILKMAEQGLNTCAAYANTDDGFLSPLLVIDEASMMVFSHFLALASLTRPDGQILLAGDHRQLSPIVAHDWESEDRPPTVLYKPYVSAYEAVLRLAEHRQVSRHAIAVHRLEETWRLPPVIRDLIRPLYARDNIDLTGPARDAAAPRALTDDPWSVVWRGGHRLLLALHDEDQSQQSNAVEAAIIERILSAEPGLPADSVAVVTPHRAQRALLTSRLRPWVGGAVGVIDTVERLQGGERPTILFSATVSDPVVISQTVEFILDLNRSNVAFSRTQELLVVVCARSLLDHIPAEVAHYESAMLWKRLRELCCREVMRADVAGAGVALLAPG